jgi:hypothetical protein
MLKYIYNIYRASVQAQHSRFCPISNSFCYDSLVTWTVICLTTAKFNPLILSMPGFTLPNITNIFVIMIWYHVLNRQSQSHCDWRSVSKSWYRAPSGAHDQISIYICLTVTFLFPWGALSDKRTGLSSVCAAGPCQRSLSRVLASWDLRPYFTVSDLRLPFSSPPTTRRVTVGVLY